VIALGDGTADVRAGGEPVALRPRAEEWSVLEFPADSSRWQRAGEGAQVEVHVQSGSLCLHLVEVRRAPP
jgi:hypothetical protein